MGKSKVRGGAKAHRKRVENRNQNIKTQQSAIQKLFSENSGEANGIYIQVPIENQHVDSFNSKFKNFFKF